jgi:hypothetical protein
MSSIELLQTKYAPSDLTNFHSWNLQSYYFRSSIKRNSDDLSRKEENNNSELVEINSKFPKLEKKSSDKIILSQFVS